ncbi:MAG: pyridoxamine 5'-phosphate oxidase family protein [Ktedonobacteraceae bacterium]
MADQTKPNNAHVEQRLREEPIVSFTTVRPDGRPHTVLVWFLWDGETFLIFSQPGNLKIRNLQRNPHITLALDGTKQGGDVVTVEGEAELLSEPSRNILVPAFGEKYASMIKTMGVDTEGLVEDYSQPIRIKPTKFIAWNG